MHPSRLLGPIALLGLCILIHAQSIAGDTTLVSLGPRYGFSRKEPLLGKRQTANFALVDVAAILRLPWSWRLGESPWSIETGLITSAGALYAAGDTGFIATVIPRVALSGWNGFASIDVGIGLGLFGRDNYGTQDFGGHVQIGADHRAANPSDLSCVCGVSPAALLRRRHLWFSFPRCRLVHHRSRLQILTSACLSRAIRSATSGLFDTNP